MAIDIAIVLGLIVVNAAFAGSELALISLRDGQLRRLEQDGPRGRKASTLARDSSRLLATIQVGITLAGFLASAVAAVSLAEPLLGPLDFLGNAAEPVAIVIVTLLLSFFTLVLGELAPKRIALQRAERWAVLAATPLTAVARVARPIVWLLARSTDLVVRLFGADPAADREEVSEDEIRDLVLHQRAFTRQQREIISGAIDIAERPLRDVVIPRRDVVTIDGATPAAEALELLVASGHSRAPVADRDLDNVVGVIHLRDLVHADAEVGRLAQDALALPETVTVLDALRQMQARRQSLAIVTNEYGGTEGIVTIEDLLEELVGEIYDESDRDVRGVQRHPDGSLVLPGAFPMHDLEDIDVELPTGEYSTVAGLVLNQLGHIPTPGERLTINGWEVDVLEMDGRAVELVKLRPTGRDAPPQAPET